MNAMVARASVAMMGRAILLALGVACLMTSARAQAPVSDQAKAMAAGSWEFSNADRDKRCTLVFKTARAPVGMQLEFDKACVDVFPFIRDVVGWTIAENDFLRLLDAKGKSMLEFSEVETGMYEAPRPGEGILFIQAAAAVGPPPKEADQMTGDWGVVRGAGNPICTLTLANTAAGPDLALKLKPGCDAFVTRFAPTAWQMDRGELLLKNARGQTWRFEESDTATWSRVPETAEPVLLVRP
jgi:Protease inhibitor Inh